MGVTSLVEKLEMSWEESQNQRDKRVEDLWKSLDTQKTGHLDFKGLQRGLRRIDHRVSFPCPMEAAAVVAGAGANWATALKNADDLLRQIMSRLDKNSDGKIDFEGSAHCPSP
jgi:solute carrier family 25 phosphate transporter 23/24/25/41